MALPDLPKLFRLDDNVALITGGARGIGRIAGVVLAQAGARVVLADKDGDAAATTARELSESGLKAEGLALDVMDKDAVAKAFAALAERTGRFDILVNNAGTARREPALAAA